MVALGEKRNGGFREENFRGHRGYCVWTPCNCYYSPTPGRRLTRDLIGRQDGNKLRYHRRDVAGLPAGDVNENVS